MVIMNYQNYQKERKENFDYPLVSDEAQWGRIECNNRSSSYHHTISYQLTAGTDATASASFASSLVGDFIMSLPYLQLTITLFLVMRRPTVGSASFASFDPTLSL
jgi:hypothetical protein